MLAPSQRRDARRATRRSGGVVMTTYAAARPADARTTLATVRAVVSVIDQLRRDPPEPLEPVEPPEWLPPLEPAEEPEPRRLSLLPP